MKEATEQKIQGNPVAAVEVLSDKFGYNGVEKSSVLTHLIQGGDLRVVLQKLVEDRKLLGKEIN